MSRATIRRFFNPSGTSPRTMRWANPSTMAVLPTPGSPISTGIVLGAARQHLNDAANLVVAANDRIELALAGHLGQIAAILFQRLVGRLRVLRGDALIAAHFLQCRHQPIAADAELLQEPAGRAGIGDQGQQQMLDRDVLVLELLGLILGLHQQAIEPAANGFTAAAGDARQPLQLLLHATFQTVEIDVGLAEYGRSQARFLRKQGGEKVLDLDVLLSAARGQALCVLQCFLSFFRETIDVHPHLLREAPNFVLLRERRFFSFRCAKQSETDAKKRASVMPIISPLKVLT